MREYLAEVKQIALTFPCDDVNNAVVVIYEAWVKGKTIYLCGNGGSASTASHFTCDLAKIGIKALCLNDNPALITAITNDNGFDNLYTEQLKNSVTTGDVLICLSVHGGAGQDKAGAWSQNLVKAIQYTKSRGGKTIGLLGYDGGLIKQIADVSITIGQSTPQVESWQLHIEHLICQLLQDYQPAKVCSKCHKIYPVGHLECLCGSNNYELIGGVTGNIEELKKRHGPPPYTIFKNNRVYRMEDLA